MRMLPLCLLLAALPVAGGNRVYELPVALYTSFQQPAPAEMVEAMQSELGVILAPSGLRFEWRSLADVNGNDLAAELAVLTFNGRCDATDLSFQSVAVGALGWTHVTDGVILPFADIDCTRIRLFLQKKLLFFPFAERQAAFGRALARVVAHELYHIFTHTGDHAPDGICKAAFSVHELLSDDFQIKFRNMSELRRLLAHSGTPPGETHPSATREASGTW